MATVEISETNQTVEVQSGVPDATSLQGNPVSAGSPSSGDVLRYDGSGWSVKAEADLDPTSLDASNLTAGSIADARVPESAVTQHEPFNADQLQGQSLPTSPSDGELLRYNGTQWEHAADTDLPILADTLASRPSAGTSDRLFYATDEQALYRDTGSEWQAVEDAFLLDNLDGLKALWRGDSIGGVDGDAVSEWADQSGLGNDLVQTTTADQPTLKTSALDGHDVVEADGSANEYLANRDASPNGLGGLLDAGDAPVTVYAVFRLTATGQYTANLFSFGNSGNNNNFLRLNLKRTPGDFTAPDGYGSLRRDNSGTSRNNKSFGTDGEWHALIYRDDGSTSEVWVDGEKVLTETQSLGAMTTDQFALFVLLRSGVAEGMTGQVAEAAVVDRDVTDAELSDIFAGARARFPTLPDDPFRQTGQTLLPNAMATWFNSPTALYDSTADKTVVAGVSPTGDVKIASYDHGDGSVDERVIASELEEDDHANPGILVPADNRFLLAYTPHFSDDTFTRRSSRDSDPRQWLSQSDLGQTSSGTATYSHLVRVPDESDKLYLFYRHDGSGGDNREFVTSTDDGQTWSSATQLTKAIGGGDANAYMDAVQNGSGRIDVIFVSASPNAVNENKLSHAYYDAASGNWKDSSGNNLTLPISADDATVIYDGTATGHVCWNWDVRIDGNGRPVVVYAEIRSETDHRYRYARWDGTSWSPDVEVATGGRSLYSSESNYSGGIAISDPTTLYVSRESGGEWDLYKYTSSDGGSTWSGSVISENHGDRDNIRPHVPKDAHSDIPVIWYAGLYSTFRGTYRMNVESPLVL